MGDLPGTILPRAWPALAVLAALALLPGCSGSGTAESGLPITVFAAASLRDAFHQLRDDFKAAHPGIEVQLSLAGSQSLVMQLQQGAPADVIALADWSNMRPLLDEELVEPPQEFARNRLVVAMPASNPAGLEKLADLRRAGLKLVVAAPRVPAGAYTREVLDNLDQRDPGFREETLRNVVSEEPNVRLVLRKVQLGEADAAFVYVTDVQATGEGVKVLTIPDEFNVSARYPLALVRRADRSSAATQAARQFIAYVRSEAGQETLAGYGFRGPE